MKRPLYHLLLCVLSVILSVAANGQVITTIAGDGTLGFAGDGGPATDAHFNLPEGIALDSSGNNVLTPNLFIADVFNHRVRRITSYGVISTIAGTGVSGYNGDGIPAITAQLNKPRGIATDKIGNIYIADDGNSRLRKIDQAGIITTVAGTGVPGYFGDGGPASAAGLYSISDVVVDTAGVIFFTDPFQNCIRKIDHAGIITTIVGGGALGFSGDGGPAVNARINGVSCLAVDHLGNLFFADVNNYRVRKVDRAGIIRTVAGVGIFGNSGDGGMATDALVSNISGLSTDAMGNLYMCDSNASVIRKVSLSGIVTRVAGTLDGCAYNGDNGNPTEAGLCNPYRLTIDKCGTLLFSDRGNERIREIKYTTGLVAPLTAGRDISIFPNPATGGQSTLCIAAPAKEQVVITIKDITGKVVKTIASLTNTKILVSLTMPSGMYFVTAKTTSATWLGKLLVE